MPELRRSAWYPFIALTLLIPLFWRLSLKLESILFIVFWGVSGAGLAYILSWRIRVDAEGVHRRRFFMWQSWPWEMLNRSERIPYGIRFPDEPWYRRTFSYAYAEEETARLFLMRCTEHRVEPAPIPVQHVKYRTGILGEVKLDAEGIHIRRICVTHYAWQEIDKALIIRRRHAGAAHLRLFAAGKRIWPRGNGGKLDPGKLEALANLVERHMPRERILACNWEAPHTVVEAEECVSIADEARKEILVATGILSPGFVGLFVYFLAHPLYGMAISDILSDPLLLLTQVAVLAGVAAHSLLCPIVYLEKQRECQRLRRQRDALARGERPCS